MTHNHFYYTKIHLDRPEKEGDQPKLVVLDGCSFPLENVEETIVMPDGRRIVILKGGHEETRIYESKGKNGKVEEQRLREWIRREIVLNPEDSDRFRKITEYKLWSETGGQLGAYEGRPTGGKSPCKDDPSEELVTDIPQQQNPE